MNKPTDTEGYGESPFVSDEDYDRAQAQIKETKK